MAKITLIGLNNFTDGHIFDLLAVPAGVDKDILVNQILLNVGEFEVLYSDADFLKFAIGNWSNANMFTFEQLYKAFKSEYNPIENYDRFENITDKRDNKFDFNGHTSDNSNSLNKVSGYNSNNLVNDSSNDTSGNASTTNSTVGNDTNVHTAHIHGNIGVTTSSMMLAEYIKTQPKLNIYEIITNMFAESFCIMVY